MSALRHPAGPAAAGTAPLSSYQRRIVEFAREGSGHGVIRATAGAGKTSTLVAVAHSLPAGTSTCFLAFARDAASELSRRLPQGVPAMTVHKLARRTLKAGLERRGVYLAEVEQAKYSRLARARLRQLAGSGGEVDGESARLGLEYLLALLNLVRLNLADAGPVELARLTDRHGLMPPADPRLREQLDASVAELLRVGRGLALEHGRVDFTDMLWIPLVEGFPPPLFDFVCVDEAQDYSLLALRFTMRLVGEATGEAAAGRLLFVGDPRQSIFGFAGADSDAIDRIVRETGATVLPLSITYRCPRSHVRLANLLAPEMEAAPAAAEGRVYWIREQVLPTWVRAGDLLLCRANAPLVATCLELARAGVPAFVLGRDLAQHLTELLERALPGGSFEGPRAFTRFAREEEGKLMRLLGSRPSSYPYVAERLDLLRCLGFLLEDAPRGAPVNELRDRVDMLFAEGSGSLALSTVHRAKGKEADRVFILYPELMPAPYARTAEMIAGEACVQFVALTRARSDLVFVSRQPPGSEPQLRENRSPPAGPGRPAAGSGWLRALARLLLPMAGPRERPAARVPRDPRSAQTVAAGLFAPADPEVIGQGPGAWQAVLEQAKELALARR